MSSVPVKIAQGPCRVLVFTLTATTYLGEQAMTNLTGTPVEGLSPVIALVSGERLYALSDTPTEVRVMEHALP